MFLVFLSFNLPSTTKKSHLSDEEVVEQIVQSQSAVMVDVLYQRYAQKVYRKCISFVKDPGLAEDLTHDIFLKVYMNLASFKRKSKFSTWLYSITYNFCIDFLRKKQKVRSVPIEDYTGAEEEADVDNLEDLQHIKAERLKRLLEKVKDEERMILLMKYKEDMSIKEIQNVFNISESAVKMRIKRAKEKIRKLNADYGAF